MLDSSVVDPYYFSGSDFLTRLDPDPHLNKGSAKFLLLIFLRKYALKSIVMTQKVKKHRFLEYLCRTIY
jgi:hypothetical protein